MSRPSKISRQKSGGIDALRGAVDPHNFEVNALRSTLYVPENKWSVWVHPFDCQNFDRSKPQGAIWSSKYQLDKFSRSKKGEIAEVWLFYDDDPKQVEDKVLRNNPMQGAWGYTSDVKLQTRLRDQVTRPPKAAIIKPTQIILIPPGERAPEDLQLQGIWIQPVHKRDMSKLDDGTSGFLQVSGDIGRAEKFSVGGAWKMLGNNDEFSRGKKKKGDALGDSKGNWQIKVRTVQGEIFPITVIPGNRIAVCKEKILEKKKIPIEDQRLFFEGTPLQDVKTVVGSGIRNGDIIDLGAMEIFVRTHKGKKFKFSVDPDQLVEEIKVMAAPSVGMQASEMRLFFKQDPMSEDYAPISKYKVKHRDVLDLPPMVIFVQPLKGPIVELDTEPTETIQKIKTKVKNRIRIPVDQQRLFFKGKELKDNAATLEQCGVKHLDTLKMQDDSEVTRQPPKKSKSIDQVRQRPQPPPKSKSTTSSRPPPPPPPATEDAMIIYVIQDWDNEKFMLEDVEPNTKLLQVKQQIYKLRKIPVKTQQLTFKRKPVKNSKTLEDSKIKHKSILHLEAKQVIIEWPNGETLPLHVNPTDPVSTLPEAIQKALENMPENDGGGPTSKRPLPPDLEYLWQRNGPLDKDMPLDQLPDDEPILVKEPPPPKKKAKSPPLQPGKIFVQPPKGRKFPFQIDPETYNFPDLKDQIAKKINRPPRKFQLVNDDTGEPLGNKSVPLPGTTYSVQDAPDPGQVTIKPPNGREFHLIVDPDDTIKDLKRKAAKPTGYPVRHLRLVDDEGNEPEDSDQPKKNQTYQVAPPQVMVEVPGEDEPVPVDVLPKDTAELLWNRIVDKTGLPHKGKPRMFFMDTDDDFLPDDTPVFQTGVEHGTPLRIADTPEITIEMPNKGPKGRSFTLVIDPDDTIQDIKKKLVKPSGYPAKHIRLVDDDGVEADDLSKPRPGRVFHLDPPELDVTLPDGRHTSVPVLPGDTVGDIKDKIDDAMGNPPKKHRVFFMDREDELEGDDTPVFQTGIEHGTPLRVEEPPEITIEMPNNGPKGRSFTLVIDPDDTIQDIKKKLVKPSGYPAKHIRLVDDDGVEADDWDKPRPGRVFHLDPPELDVTLPDGRHTTVPVLPGDTVGDIKDKIDDAMGNPPKKHRVFFMDREDELEGDDTPVFQTGIEHGTPLRVEEPPEITIEMPNNGPKGRSFTLVIDPDDTIQDIKKKLVKPSGYPVKHIRLVDDDGVEADDLGKPRPGRVFHLDPPELDVTLPDGRHTTVPVLPGDTVGDIKDKIDDAMGNPPKKHRVFFMDREDELKGDDTPIFKIGVGHGTPLEVQPNEVTVEVPNGNKGRSFTLVIDPDDTIQDIKKKLVKPSGFPVKHIRLVDDDGIEPPNSSKPRPGRVFHLDPPEIEVTLPDGTTIPLKLKPNQTVGDIKDMVVGETGQPVAGNRIFFFDGEEELDDDAQVFKTGIKNGTALQMKAPENPEISVKLPGGRSFNLVIDPEDPEGIKSDISRYVGMPASDLRVSWDGEEIDDDFDPSQLSKGDTLVVDPAVLDVVVGSDRYRLSILPTDTIDDVKEMLEDKTGIPKTKQRVFFLDADGSELDDGTPLGKSGLKLGGALEMQVPENPEIEVKLPGGRTFNLVIDPDDPEGIKSEISRFIGIPAKDFRVSLDDYEIDDDFDPSRLSKDDILMVDPTAVEIALPNSDRCRLSILPSTTIGELKSMLEDETGMPRAKQRVFFFDEDGKELDDDTTLATSGFKLGDALQMREPDMVEIPFKASNGRSFVLYIDPEDPSRVEVEAEKKKFTLNVLPTQSIADVKDVIEEMVGLPKGSTSRAFFLDPEGNELDDDTAFVKAELKQGAAMQMRPVDEERPEVTFKSKDGRSFILVIEPEETVKEVKKRLREKTGLFVGGFSLGDVIFDDVDEEEVFLDADPRIRQGTVLSVEPPEVEIEIPGSLQKVKMVVLPTTTMRDVKRVVEEQIPEFKQKEGGRMFFLDGCEEIDDDTPFEKLGFESGMKLEVRDIEIRVQHFNGDLITMNAETTEYIGDVKERISKRWNLPVDQQHLSFNKKPVREDANLKAQGITQGSLLVLEPMTLYVTDPSGKELEFVVDMQDSIESLKRKVSQKTKTPIDVQCIMSGATEFQSRQTLKECNVRHGDRLAMELFKLTVMNWHGDSVSIRGLKPSSMGAGLKMKIELETDLPSKLQHLKLNGMSVKEEETLFDQGIKHRSALVLEDPAEVDLSLPQSETAKTKTFKTKKFKATEDDIWPVVSDWKKRVFFFDNDEKLDDGKVQLTILHWNGDKFVLRGVPLGETVEQLKDRIRSDLKIKLKKEMISFNGKKLDVDRTLRQQLVQNNSILVLEGKREENIIVPESEKISFGVLPAMLVTTFEIKVRHWNGDEYSIKVEPTDYIDDVKETITGNLRIPIDQQRISFNGQEVSETENLREQGIESDGVLILEPMRVQVITPANGSLDLVVELDDTIRTLKQKILTETGVPVDIQKIMFGGEELKDSKSLGECAVDHEDQLAMEEYSVSIMHWTGDVFPLSGILPTDTIDRLQAEILRIRHVPKKQQLLKFQGKTLAKNKTLEDEGIAHKSVIIMEEAPDETISQSPRRKISFMQNFMAGTGLQPNFELTIVHWSGDKFSIESDPNEYADDVKDNIQKKQGIPVDQQFLSFKGTAIRDDANLQAQEIENGSTLHLEPMRVFVETPNGKNLQFEVEKDFTIRKLKALLTEKGNGGGDELVLVLGGKELEDGKTLEDYEIKHEETITLEIFKITIMDNSGIPFDLTKVHPNDTLAKVKKEIMALKSTPKDQQKLSFQGEALSDKKTLKDFGIRHKNVIVLEEIEPDLDLPQSDKFKLSFRSVSSTADLSSASKRSVAPGRRQDSIEDDCETSEVEVDQPNDLGPKTRTFVAPEVPQYRSIVHDDYTSSSSSSEEVGNALIQFTSPQASMSKTPIMLKKKWWSKDDQSASSATAKKVSSPASQTVDSQSKSRKISFQKGKVSEEPKKINGDASAEIGTENSTDKKKVKKREGGGESTSKSKKTTIKKKSSSSSTTTTSQTKSKVTTAKKKKKKDETISTNGSDKVKKKIKPKKGGT